MTIIEKGGRTDRIRGAVIFEMEAMGASMIEEQQSAVPEGHGRLWHRETMSATIEDVVNFKANSN